MSASQISPLPVRPFAELILARPQPGPLRRAITEHDRAPEANCVQRLVDDAALPRNLADAARRTATQLVKTLRDKPSRGGVQDLMQEFSLSSREGVALMCVAEAMLRIPDTATRDALIRDKIGGGNWRAHLGKSPSIFVNAATWGLVVTGTLSISADEESLSNALLRLVARGGESVLRKGVDIAMRLMGEQFVIGETIATALARAKTMEAEGFYYSYDMLGEAALTASDAGRYYRDYEQAIEAIGAAATGSSIFTRPGISIKLSALHPRYSRAQQARVTSELLPRVGALCVLAKNCRIGVNIDAEESDRLELSLDLLEQLSIDPALAGWDGLGFVVQAYQKRAPFVVDFAIDLARRSQHRLMIRLVKGAYWDGEIKRAQVDGMDDFPVFTRKAHTDVCYLACARKLLASRDAVFPQFATHNAQTLASVLAMAGDKFAVGEYEFQCLHGMGETIYRDVVDVAGMNRPCRIYAPVGTHETLLAYLVRRLLENGANSSFIHQIHDRSVPLAALVADPVASVAAASPIGAPHPQIALPRDLYGSSRRNSPGIDLTNETTLATLSIALQASAKQLRRATAMLATAQVTGHGRKIVSPADHRDLVGEVVDSTTADIDHALADAETAKHTWSRRSPSERAECLFRASDLIQHRKIPLIDLLVREAGKSLPNAVAELREATDFLRYYGAQVRDHFSNDTHPPRGTVACISPWNFPLAILTGQVAAALATGNAAIAKPAEETPLIAGEIVAILRDAGVPAGAVQLLPGDGTVGAALVQDPRVHAVMFTGSIGAAKSIQRSLSQRLNPGGAPVPLIAETGGVNALIVDSSALPEQVVSDALTSAFDSAGQRCSALRVICVQDEVADKLITMLRQSMAELMVGNPDRLSTDIGPLISSEARDTIRRHIDDMRNKRRPIHTVELAPETRWGTFQSPTIIELASLAELTCETFGPVLHVLRYARKNMEALVEAINATGYGLTFGVHSRLDETTRLLSGWIEAGNVYVNRNLIGATVGVQPFGGHRLSGTGPKAGGPLYLLRLVSAQPQTPARPAQTMPDRMRAWIGWLEQIGKPALAAEAMAMFACTPLSAPIDLDGPVGERNEYFTVPRGTIACLAADVDQLLRQLGAILATGNRARIDQRALTSRPLAPQLKEWILEASDAIATPVDAVLYSGDEAGLIRLNRYLAALSGPIIPLIVPEMDGRLPLELMILERCRTTNTTASGGNASLMMIGR
jgi:RHH-type transcriptional regulator, proline utilization regulon repressor / proline dehydrogenase / delta 1-pyrroline-5-carboxylate dehydrogenase